MVPSWLGVDEGLRRELDAGHEERLAAMFRDWPFFRSSLDLIEMVLAKGALLIAAHYERPLVAPELAAIGSELRRRFASATELLLRVADRRSLLDGNPVLRRSIDVRNPYVDPINLVQVELLRRLRAGEGDESALGDALLVSVNGIAAGMRNTG